MEKIKGSYYLYNFYLKKIYIKEIDQYKHQN